MGRNKFFLFSLVLPVFIIYNNCSPSSGNLSGSALLNSASGVGNEFSGQRQLEHFNPSPNCASEKVGAIESLQLNGDSRSAQLHWNRCNDQGQGGVVFDSVRLQSYDPYLAAYENKIYASPVLHEGLSDYVYYREFCHNEVLQLDFTIQHIQIDLPGLPDPLPDWIGVLISGASAQYPGLQFNGGYLQTATDGSQFFGTDNDTYHVEMYPEQEPGKKRAVLTRANGTTIPFQCWFDSQP